MKKHIFTLTLVMLLSAASLVQAGDDNDQDDQQAAAGCARRATDTYDSAIERHFQNGGDPQKIDYEALRAAAEREFQACLLAHGRAPKPFVMRAQQILWR